MAKYWMSKMIEVEEDRFGHGLEKLALDVQTFLNEREIREGCASVSCYLDMNRNSGPKLCALFLYRR